MNERKGNSLHRKFSAPYVRDVQQCRVYWYS